MHVYMYEYIIVYTHKYTHTYMFTHTHTHTKILISATLLYEEIAFHLISLQYIGIHRYR